MTDPIEEQGGGDHYIGQGIQPIEYILANELDFCEGNVVKYVTRWRYKNGIEDLYKAKHYIEFLIKDVEETHEQFKAMVEASQQEKVN
jgi:hypothetical protein